MSLALLLLYRERQQPGCQEEIELFLQKLRLCICIHKLSCKKFSKISCTIDEVQ